MSHITCKPDQLTKVVICKKGKFGVRSEKQRSMTLENTLNYTFGFVFGLEYDMWLCCVRSASWSPTATYMQAKYNSKKT